MTITTNFPPLEMLRTNSLHMGESQILRNPFAASQIRDAQKTDSSFESYLVGALDYVNGKQLSEASIAQQLITDPDSVDIHDVTKAMAEASMSLEAANRIITQMITSWNEITTTR
jgi:flagellar hook-basal body complex protein FliE